MIHIFLIENYPWVWWCTIGKTTDYGRWGEWAWVGRSYE